MKVSRLGHHSTPVLPSCRPRSTDFIGLDPPLNQYSFIVFLTTTESLTYTDEKGHCVTGRNMANKRGRWTAVVLLEKKKRVQGSKYDR